MAYRRRANCRFVPTVVKIANADCVCSGAQRAPCRLAMIPAKIQRRKASGFVIARSEATWQSRSIRPDHRALPANTVTLRGGASRTPPPTRRVRSAELLQNLRLPMALRERRYTPYFGVCHFNDSLFGSAAYRRARLSPPLQGACVCPAVGINRQCLPEIATGAKRPRNDKSGGYRRFNGSLYESAAHSWQSRKKRAPEPGRADFFPLQRLMWAKLPMVSFTELR